MLLLVVVVQVGASAGYGGGGGGARRVFNIYNNEYLLEAPFAVTVQVGAGAATAIMFLLVQGA
jgi:hypothetical protein